jgi:hypothetical protein
MVCGWYEVKTDRNGKERTEKRTGKKKQNGQDRKEERFGWVRV